MIASLHRRAQLIQPDQQQAIEVPQSHTPRGRAPLVARNSDIGIALMYHDACLKESFAHGPARGTSVCR